MLNDASQVSGEYKYRCFDDLEEMVEKGILTRRKSGSYKRGTSSNGEEFGDIEIKRYSLKRFITENTISKPAVIRKYDVDYGYRFIGVEIYIPRYYDENRNIQEDRHGFSVFQAEYSTDAVRMMTEDFVNHHDQNLLTDRDFRQKYRLQSKRGPEVIAMIKELNRDRINDICDDEIPKIWLVRHKYLKQTLTFCFCCHFPGAGKTIRQELFHVSVMESIPDMVRDVKSHIVHPERVADVCINFSEELRDCVRKEFPKASICFDLSQIALMLDEVSEASGNRRLTHELWEIKQELYLTFDGATIDSGKRFRSILAGVPNLFRKYPDEKKAAKKYSEFISHVEKIASESRCDLYRQFAVPHFRTELSFTLNNYIEETSTNGRPYSTERMIFHMMYLQTELSRWQRVRGTRTRLEAMPMSFMISGMRGTSAAIFPTGTVRDGVFYDEDMIDEDRPGSFSFHGIELEPDDTSSVLDYLWLEALCRMS